MVSFACRLFSALAFAVATSAELVENSQGKPQTLSKGNVVGVCAGRSQKCDVKFDVPAVCAGVISSCPIAFFFHGHGGGIWKFISGKSVSASLRLHERGYVGIYPQSDGKGWNYVDNAGANEPLFIAGIIQALRELGAQGRVYAYGHSNGGEMVSILGANVAQHELSWPSKNLPFVAIVPSAGQLLETPLKAGPGPHNRTKPTAASAKMAVMALHGDSDTTVPYDGGKLLAGFELLSEPDSNKVWKEHNGCVGELSSKNISASFQRTPAGDIVETIATHWIWGGCPANAPVEYYQVRGASHAIGYNVTLESRDEFFIVFDFFDRIERTLATSSLWI